MKTQQLPSTLRGHTVSIKDMLSAGKLVAARLGRSPRADEYKAERQVVQREAVERGELELLPSYGAIHRAFPIWDQFLVAAELQPIGGRRTSGGHGGGRKQVCTPDVCTAAINAARKELGDPISASDYSDWREQALTNDPTLIYTLPSLASIFRRFPSWNAAVLTAIKNERQA